MPENQRPFRVAAVQAAPVFLNRDASVEKACQLIAEAAGSGARLVVFPETFLPAYPDWIWAVPPREKTVLDELYAELLDQAVAVPSEATRRLGAAARAAGAYVVMGLNERNVEASGGSLFNSLIYLDDQGNLAGKRRKLVPTAAERLVWAQGDGSTLEVWESSLGKIGALICWENYMPLARYAMYAWGTEIYVAATWDRSNAWLNALRYIAGEGGVHVIGCCMALRTDDIPERYGFKRFYPADREWINVGNSVVVDPEGSLLAGPLEKKQEILYAELDPRQRLGARRLLDVAGHYGRPDVFQLVVRREPRPMVRMEAGLNPVGEERL